MSRTGPALVLALCLPLLAGCVSTEVFDFERDPALADRRYTTVVVLCSAEDVDRRRAVETEVVRELRDAGYDAVAAGIAPDRSVTDAHPDRQALVWIGYGAYEKDVVHHPGYVTHEFGYAPYAGFHRHGRHHHHGVFFGPTFSTTYTPPHDETNWTLRTRVELVDLRSDRIVWSANVDASSGSSGLEQLSGGLGERIADLFEETGQVVRTPGL